MTHISNERVGSILREYSVSAGKALVDGIQTYIALLLQWNRSISLTTVTDPEEIVRFHFGESFFAAASAKIMSGRLADVGSGAGFPGLALAMLIPTLELTLIESNAKKATFLEEVSRKLSLGHVSVFRGRMEEFGREAAGQGEPFDYVTARAFGQFAELLAWAKNYLAPAGKVCLWLGEADVSSIMKTDGWCWAEPAPIPGSKRRFILAGAHRAI